MLRPSARGWAATKSDAIYRQALEGSVHEHFGGNLINCMSCSAEMFLTALASNLARTSTDSGPTGRKAHGLHLYTNSQVCMFFGELTWGDWDMFQSGHPMGTFPCRRACGGGCPVYVSDKPDGHSFDVLKTLVMPDRSILRAKTG